MKQATNFRLDETTLTKITVLIKDLHTTKTDIVEKAVAQFAGALSATDADNILSAIQTDKNSKNIDLHL